ncbi:MAG: GGDEF domain-containing protein [Actinobacteria bacterium]|nr:GGDEF domain-containing protein [Actinomycetota bacterium]
MQFDQITNSKQSLTIKSGLFLLLMVMIVPFIAFSIFKAIDINKRIEAEVQGSSLSLAKSVAQSVDDCVISTGEFLAPIANNKDVRTQNYSAVKVWLKEIWPRYPFYNNITFVDANGDVKVASRSESKGSEGINVSDTVYYKRAMQSDSVAVGDLMHDKASGIPVVHVTYPVFDFSGKRIGFIAAAYDLAKMQSKLMQSDIPKHTLVAVLDNKGSMIATNREPEKWVGRSFPGETGSGKTLERTSGADKVESPNGSVQLFGFATASKVPWTVRAGVDEGYFYDQVKGKLINHFVALIPFLLVAFLGWFWVGRGIDELYRRTEYLSLVDPLTELWNYRKLNHDFDRELSRAKRYGEQLSFAMIDVDHFKHYNDHNGHQLGDELLRSVADVIRGAVRDIDCVYRCGGEEMCVLLPATDNIGAMSVAERIRAAIEESNFIGEENQPAGKLTISIGVATYPRDSISKEGLVQSADVALYRVKDKGRNRVAAYNEDCSNWNYEGSYFNKYIK